MPHRGEDPSVRPARIRPVVAADDRALMPADAAWHGLLPLEPRLLMAAEVALFGGAGSNIEIASNDSTPALLDGTHFGGAFVADAATIHATSRTFVVKNLGGTVLGLTGTPRVQISGANASDFTVSVQIPDSTNKLGWQDTAYFAITFNPTAAGVRTAIVRVPNNDSNESNYTFTITGIGFDPAGSGTAYSPVAVTGGAYYYTLVPGLNVDPPASTGDSIDINYAIFPVNAYNLVTYNNQVPPLTVNLDSTNSSQTLVSSMIGMRTGEQRIILLPTNSGVFSNSALNSFSLVYTAEMLSIHTAAADHPSVDLTGKDSTPIASGDVTPSRTDGTNLGSARPGQQLASATFTLNITGSNFSLLGNPNIQISGADASYFSASAVTTVNSTTRTFTITFKNATAYGVYSALVTIPNNDPDHPLLTFTVRATLAPAVFDEAYYLAHNPDVAADVAADLWASGYAHFVAAGQFEGRRVNPIYDEAYYLAHNPDVAAAVTAGTWKSGFEHFAAVGQTENRRFSLYFSEAAYLKLNPDVAAAVTAGTWASGLAHYTAVGAAAGRPVSPYFDEDFYRRANTDVNDAIVGGAFSSGFLHFVEAGHAEARRFSPFFDEAYYLDQNADVDAAVTAGDFATGFDHFLEFGQHETRTFTKYFDETFYTTLYTDIASAVTAGAWQSGFEHFIAFGKAEDRAFIARFDEAYYLAQNPDVALGIAETDWASGFAHFVATGRNENRRYSPDFYEPDYLAANPDVVDAINGGAFASGLEHYVYYGQLEGRPLA